MPGTEDELRTLRRSVRLLKAFRREQTDPDFFYGLLAADAVSILSRRMPLQGATVLDVGGGAGYLTKAFQQAGARSLVVEPDVGELSWRGARPQGAIIADGCSLPFRDAAADLVVSSNVLEHAAHPWQLGDEMVRVARPGGLVWISFTNWLSPWGGHETSPWHYLGGERAAARYRRHHGKDPKNRYGESLYRIGVGETLRWARRHEAVEVLEAGPRYHPAWARGVASIPGLREVATWNLEVLLRKR